MSSVHPCQNGGIIVPLGPESYQCICPKEYIGKKCEGEKAVSITAAHIKTTKLLNFDVCVCPLFRNQCLLQVRTLSKQWNM